MHKDIIVVGASAGGIEALKKLVSGLPPDLGAAVFVVQHTAPNSPGLLPSILQRSGRLPALSVKNKAPIEPGRIYVAIPDHHLIIEPGTVRSTRGPKENHSRPAVDPLFRSAALAYGPRVIGIVLTGGLDDGTSGLWTIKCLGGTAIVQDPEEAFADSMPRSALKHVRVDHCVPMAEMGSLLVRLTKEPAESGETAVPEEAKIEVEIAGANAALEAGVQNLGIPSQYSCPECHGVLLQWKEGNRIRFRCHTGHAFSAQSLMAEVDEAIEDALWNAIRALQEGKLLFAHLAAHLEVQKPLSEQLLAKAAAVGEISEGVRRSMIDLKSASNVH
jgi:two-component system chemotaxis response regulator CheB